MDMTYKSRVGIRREIMKQHPDETTAFLPGSEDMVTEFYKWMVEIYLPRRFPSMYIPIAPTDETPSDKTRSVYIRNRVSNDSLPLEPASAHSALKILGGHVDTDFLFLSRNVETGKYHLDAFVCCFPSGFSLSKKKIGRPLAEIHAPVPGYAEKLERSMDRFFDRIEVGQIVRRANWTITTDDELYREEGTHLYAEDDTTEDSPSDVGREEMLESDEDGAFGALDNVLRDLRDQEPDQTAPHMSRTSQAEEIRKQKENVNVEDCRLRCERQTLHRLPMSRGLVFAFKTYQYTLKEIKEEGSGEDLAAAIEGLSKGNAPNMKYYKRGVVWGDKVVEYLRS